MKVEITQTDNRTTMLAGYGYERAGENPQITVILHKSEHFKEVDNQEALFDLAKWFIETYA